jgi:hypothetical protein
MKKIEMLFYAVNPSEKNTGLKFVLWEINDGTNITHDWGFAEWDGNDWQPIEVPEGYTATVARWANTIDPAVLLKESRIVKI